MMLVQYCGKNRPTQYGSAALDELCHTLVRPSYICQLFVLQSCNESQRTIITSFRQEKRKMSDGQLILYVENFKFFLNTMDTTYNILHVHFESQSRLFLHSMNFDVRHSLDEDCHQSNWSILQIVPMCLYRP